MLPNAWALPWKMVWSEERRMQLFFNLLNDRSTACDRGARREIERDRTDGMAW